MMSKDGFLLPWQMPVIWRQKDLQSSTLATEMVLFTTATAKTLDQRNVVVYDALSDDQQKIHVIIVIISAYIAIFINLHR
jgi:hypothetical protein